MSLAVYLEHWSGVLTSTLTASLIESFDSDYLSAGENTIKLDFSDMAEGLYIYEINTENVFFSGKIIKN